MKLARLREIRELHGWSQSKLAEEADVSRDGISNYETGRREAWPSTAMKLADALGVGISDLVARVEESPLPKGPSPLSAERALAIADPDDFRRVVKDTPTEELEQTALELAKLTKAPTREDLAGDKDNKAAHLRTMANYRIGVINVELDSRGVRSPVEHVATRLNDALTPPEEPREEEQAG